MNAFPGLSPDEQRAVERQLAALQMMLVVRKARLPLSVLPAPASLPLATVTEQAPVSRGAGVFSLELADA